MKTYRVIDYNDVERNGDDWRIYGEIRTDAMLKLADNATCSDIIETLVDIDLLGKIALQNRVDCYNKGSVIEIFDNDTCEPLYRLELEQ